MKVRQDFQYVAACEDLMSVPMIYRYTKPFSSPAWNIRKPRRTRCTGHIARRASKFRNLVASSAGVEPKRREAVADQRHISPILGLERIR